MDCEIGVVTQCSQEYSEKLASNTKETFTKVCAQIVGSGYDFSSCWWTAERQKNAIIAAIVIGIILVVIISASIYGCVDCYRKKAAVKL